MKRIFITAFACSCLMAGNVYAATVDSVVVSDFEKNMITVSGTVEDGDGIVSVLVIKKGEKFGVNDLLGKDGSLQNAVINDDKYSVSFEFSADAGFYEVYASNSKTPYEFEYISKESVLQFVDDLGNKAVAEKEIYKELKRYAESIGIDIDFALSEYEQGYLSENIIYYADRIADKGIDGVKSIVKLTKSELEFMSKLKTASAASSVNQIINEYNNDSEINLTEYNRLTSVEKTNVCTKFVEKKYTDMNSFRSDFERAVKDVSSGNSGGNSGSGGGSGSGSGSGKPSSNMSSMITSQPEAIVVRDNVEEANGARLFEMYTDVENVEWAWNAILYMTDNGIMQGVGDNKFAPNNNLTREQFAKIITLAFNKYNENNVSDFKDVSSEHWASAYVASAKAAGIMRGIGDNVFGVLKPMTREDMCVAIYRGALNEGMSFSKENKDFTDFNNVSDYAKEAVAKMAGAGIISGMEDGSFQPEKTATRAQAAKIMYLILTLDN